jgi:hypothetical protein
VKNVHVLQNEIVCGKIDEAIKPDFHFRAFICIRVDVEHCVVVPFFGIVELFIGHLDIDLKFSVRLDAFQDFLRGNKKFIHFAADLAQPTATKQGLEIRGDPENELFVATTAILNPLPESQLLPKNIAISSWYDNFRFRHQVSSAVS